MKKNALLAGTLILTLAGLITRIMGFFYKIYLSNTLTAENLGLYQLIFPVYGICFTLYASGIQTAISQLVANCPRKAGSSHQQKNILRCGMTVSVSIALCLSAVIFWKSDFIAAKLLMDARCSQSLRVLSLVFPFCGITACINGYYYGLKKTAVPAATQLLEQIVRISSVYFLALYLGNGDKKVTCELAVLGIVLGEIASDIFSILSLLSEDYRKRKKAPARLEKYKVPSPLPRLASLALPLTGNRLVVSILHSLEAVLVPYTLQKFGMSTEESLSLYGILSGMSMPFILFPSAITNSLAVLLLPTVSEAQAAGNKKRIQSIGLITMKCSLIIGIFSTCIFILFGNAFGSVFFHNASAGYFMVILSWLCPFMYLSTTLSSMINGLGQTRRTFFNTVTGLGVRIGLIFYLVPKSGITGYLISLLISQLVLTLLDYRAITKTVPLPIDAVNCIGKPVIILIGLGSLFFKFYERLAALGTAAPLLLLLGICLLLCICYVGMLLLTKAVTSKELTFR